MSETPSLRASDADRERTVALLREHAAQGRLTLEEFTDRMSSAYLARTMDELEGLAGDLPSAGAKIESRRRRTRLVFSLFGSTSVEGRARVGRHLTCLTGFGNVDLDLRRATLEGPVITIVAFGVFGSIDVYLPEGVEVDLHGLAFFGHKRARGNDVSPYPGTPVVRVFVLSIFAGIDVWRVPIQWTQKTWREVIRGIRSGAHKELEVR
ncbi:MAG: hypothetical protein QOF27_773 [Gaiellaceae bacterium]|jgi:hypothetical protein|nr:hypothetical protein [Gaiellaceae bacterium]